MTVLRDIVLATKGVRRVRTPAGVAYFGQPIGTIITRDMRERAKAKRRKKTRVSRPKARPQRRAERIDQAKPYKNGRFNLDAPHRLSDAVSAGDRLAAKLGVTKDDPNTNKLWRAVANGKGNKVHVARDDDGKVLGVAKVTDYSNMVLVHELYKRKDSKQGDGVGTALMADVAYDALRKNRGKEYPVTVGVSGALEEAKPFYKKLGFTFTPGAGISGGEGSSGHIEPQALWNLAARSGRSMDGLVVPNGVDPDSGRSGDSGRGKSPLGKLVNDAAPVFKPKKRAAGSYLLNGKQHRITKASTDFGEVNIVKDRRSGSIFVLHDGKPTARYSKSGAKSIRNDIIANEYKKAKDNGDLMEYDDRNNGQPVTTPTRKPIDKNIPSPYDEQRKYGLGSPEHVRASLAMVAAGVDKAPKMDLYSAKDGLGMELVRRRKEHGVTSPEYNEVYEAHRQVTRAYADFDKRNSTKDPMHAQATERLNEGEGANGVRKWNSADARKQYEGDISMLPGDKLYFINKDGDTEVIAKTQNPHYGQGSHWKSSTGANIGRPGDPMIGDYIRNNSKDGNVYFPRLEYAEGSSHPVEKPVTPPEPETPAPTLASVAKPVRKPRAKAAKKIEPSKDTKDYIDEMRGYHDRGFAGWDEAMGQERQVGQLADRQADRFDRNNDRIEKILIDEEEAKIALEEDGIGTGELPGWQKVELRMLQQENERILKDLNVLNDLADLDRDITADDLPDGFGESINMFNNSLRSDEEHKRFMADVLNTKITATQAKDANGRTVPPQALMDARDDYADLGKQLMKEINAHMDNDPGVQAARKKFDDIDNGDPRPELDMTGFQNMTFEQRRKLSTDYTKELDAWYQRRGFTDSSYSSVRDFDSDRAAKMRQADRDLAIAERRVKLEYLNSIRPMGAHPEAMPRFVEGKLDTRLGRARQVRGKAEQAQWDAMAEEALSVYPSSWVAAIPDKYFIRAWSDRAFYNGPPTGTDGETLPDIHTNNGTHVVAFRPLNQGGVPEDYRNTSFSDYSVESAAHEFGHAMETFIPGITALEWAENYHRSGRNRDNGNWEEIKTQAGMAGGESGFEDNWKNNYPGRSYAYESDWNGDIHKEHWEVFTTGVQDTFGRSSRSKKYTHTGDDSVEQIILALMVTSNYYEDEEDFRK